MQRLTAVVFHIQQTAVGQVLVAWATYFYNVQGSVLIERAETDK